MPHRSFVVCAAVWMLLWTVLVPTAAAQTARDGWRPALDGALRVVLEDADGRLYLGGDFQSVDGLPRPGLARLLPDGRVDPDFAPLAEAHNVLDLKLIGGDLWVAGEELRPVGGVKIRALLRLDLDGSDIPIAAITAGYIEAIEPDGDGGAWIGGRFFPNGDGPAVHLARLDAILAPHPVQPDQPDSDVLDLQRTDDGALLVGGQGRFPGLPATRLARLTSSGRVDPLFNPAIDGPVRRLALARNGDVLVAGVFNTVHGQAQPSYVRLRADGRLSDENVRLPITCCALAVVELSNGDVVLGGSFDSSLPVPGGPVRLVRIPLMRLNGDFAPFGGAVDDEVTTLHALSDTSVIVGGFFQSIGGVAQPHAARVLPDGSLDTTLQVSSDTGLFTTVALTADGAWLGGDMAQVGGSASGRLVKLDHRGRRAAATSPQLNNVPLALLPLDNDRLLVGGAFTMAGASVANHLLLMEQSSGSRLPLSLGTDGDVHALARLPDGRILVGGNFSTIGGVARRALARLNADFSVDTGFNPALNAGAVVEAIAVARDGSVVLGGSFTALGIEPRQNLAKLNANGSLAALFTPDPNARVDSLLIDGSGRVLVGGAFTSIGGVARNRVARLSAGGAVEAFAPALPVGTTRVPALALQADGKVLLGGNGNLLRRVLDDGSADPTYTLPFTGSVAGLGLAPDGRLWVIGSFGAIGGEVRNGIARIAPPERRASQVAAYTASLDRVFWGLRGVGPEVSVAPRASISFDRGLSFQPLPAMAPQSILWRTSLDLPVDTPALLRIEADHAGGPSGASLSQLRRDVLLFEDSALFSDGFE